jgi:type IV pilus assembly protein PilQ
MRHVVKLVALSAAAMVAVATGARAASANGPHGSGEPRHGGGSVTSLSILPSTGKAEVVVAIDSSVDVQDFTLTNPDRIVVDFTGATLDMPARFYDKVTRGGITNVRFAQYRPDVVRLVIELDGAHPYEVKRAGQAVRIAVTGGGSGFDAWHSGAAPAAPAAAPAAMAHARASVTTAVAPIPVQQSTQSRITVTYQEADIRDVLAAFAAFSGRTIVVGKEVSGTVTAEVRDQPWDVALQSILTAQGLAAAEDQYGILTVDSYKNIASKQASEPLTTELIPVNYAKASSLVETMKSLLSKDCPRAEGGGVSGPCTTRGTAAADTGTNTLIITEVTSRMDDVKRYVRSLDVRTPQVAIKAKIIFVSRTNIENLGISYDLGSNQQFFTKLAPRINPATGAALAPAGSDGLISIGGDALSGIANAGRSFKSNSALSLIYSTMLGKYSLTTFLDALQEVRLSDTQAEPSVVTLDNRKASLLSGEETPLRVIDASSQQGAGAAAPRAVVQFKETGIILEVTPHITNNRQILMTVHAEQSQLTAAAADLGFTFLKRRADSQLLVSDGETSVIGGLTLTQVTTDHTGIPILVELPLIGRLFGESTTTENKQDLLILITPHIVDEGEVIRTPGTGR